MGFARPRQEFRVVLAGGEEGMVLELDQFHQAPVRGGAADLIARLQQQVAVLIDDEEIALPYLEFPWFKAATIQ